ncbi:MAG: heme-binding protein [Chloroflexi bacterium]|nr:heme-binding protein [Chloroflexota bacterium]
MPSSPPGIMTLTLADSERVAEGAIEMAEELGIKISVAVCDAGGRLMLFNRMAGAVWASAQSAQGKALTSAGFNMSTGRFTSEAGVGHIRLFGPVSDSPDMIYLKGAVAIFRDNVAVGSCGVAGATAEKDETCARAGVAKLMPAKV